MAVVLAVPEPPAAEELPAVPLAVVEGMETVQAADTAAGVGKELVAVPDNPAVALVADTEPAGTEFAEPQAVDIRHVQPSMLQ